MNRNRQNKRYFQEDERDEAHDIILKRVPHRGCRVDTAKTVAETLMRHIMEHHGGDEADYTSLYPKSVDVQEAGRHGQETINVYVHLLNNRRNKELVNICERRPLSILNEIVSVVESSTIAHHIRDLHKQYLWEARTGAAPCRLVGCRRCASENVRDLQGRLDFPNPSRMKRPCSQSLINQQDEKKTKGYDILRFAEHHDPTDVRTQLLDGAESSLNDKERSDAASDLSPEVSTASSTRMESTKKPQVDSGVQSESPSPEVVSSRSVKASTMLTPVDLVRSIISVSDIRPVPADRETAIMMIRALQTAASSDKASPQPVGGPQLVDSPQLVSDRPDLPIVTRGSILARSDTQLTPPASVQAGQTAVATTSSEETAPNIQLVSDLADISIGTEDMVLVRPSRQLTPPPALCTGLIVGISRPDRSPYWVVQPWPSGGASMPLDEWKKANRL